MKTLTFSAALGFFVMSPASAQVAVDEGKDAIEETSEAVVPAGEASTRPTISTPTPPPPAPAPPVTAGPPEPIDYSDLEATPADYPPASWLAGEEGNTYYKLKVDAKGKVTDCTIVDGTGYEALNQKTCEIAMTRVKFHPALDEDGNPVESTFAGYQSWTKSEPQFSGTSTIHVQYTVTERGETIDCNVVEVSGIISESMQRTIEREPCPGANKRYQAPYRDAGGNPVAKRVDLMVVVKTDDVAE